MNSKENLGKIVIYESPEGESKIEVKTDHETVWLNQEQMALLFNKDRKTITEHIGNIFKEKELSKSLVCRKFQHTAADGKKYQVNFYDLDVIISVGYRVKSIQGTKFRIWANKVLKSYLIKGYAVNEEMLITERKKFTELRRMIGFISKKKDFELLEGKEKELIDIINDFALSFSLLSHYDEGKVELIKSKKPFFKFSYDQAKKLIEKFRISILESGEGGPLLANEIDTKFKNIIDSIYQTFDADDLYQSLEEKAANLLYLTIKDHPFSDGNKRIGSLLFVYYLDKNNYLYNSLGDRKIDEGALATLALLIAVSDPKDKEVMINITTNLIN